MYQLPFLKKNSLKNGCPRACNIHLQLIQVHSQITLNHFMSGMVPYINKIILIPSSHPLYHCCHSSLICKYTKACVCIKSNTHYCYYYFKHSSLLAQLRRSIKILILSSLFPSLKFILSLCRSKFLTCIIFLKNF